MCWARPGGWRYPCWNCWTSRDALTASMLCPAGYIPEIIRLGEMAEADGNRTRQAELLGLVGFEDRDTHQDADASVNHVIRCDTQQPLRAHALCGVKGENVIASVAGALPSARIPSTTAPHRAAGVV